MEQEMYLQTKSLERINECWNENIKKKNKQKKRMECSDTCHVHAMSWCQPRRGPAHCGSWMSIQTPSLRVGGPQIANKHSHAGARASTSVSGPPKG